MKVFEATLTSKGQITVPAPLRSMLGLKVGDKVVFRQGEEGDLRIEARTASLGDLFGVVKDVPKRVTGDLVARWIHESRDARWKSSRRR